MSALRAAFTCVTATCRQEGVSVRVSARVGPAPLRRREPFVHGALGRVELRLTEGAREEQRGVHRSELSSAEKAGFCGPSSGTRIARGSSFAMMFTYVRAGALLGSSPRWTTRLLR